MGHPTCETPATGGGDRFGRSLSRARGDLLAILALLAAAILDSLPPLLNAAGTQSDAAVVGLQAMHLLRGESSWFLWGSGYQTSVDSWVAAGFFRIFGPTPLALMLSAFVGYVALIGFAYATLRRRFEPWSAALLVAPLVLIAGPVHIHAFYPPRQASLTLLFAAVFGLDGAPEGKKPPVQLALGAFVAGLACFADPYCLLFVPAILLLVALTARDVDRRRFPLPPLLVGIAGLATGLAPFWFLSHSHGASHGVYGLTTAVLSHNLKLLTDVCLPFLLSTQIMVASPTGSHAWWHPPAWFRVIQLAGATLLIAGVVLGGFFAFSRAIPSSVRRIGAYGAVMLPITLAAFLFSVMAIDRLSARYLVAIVLTAPFSFAPVLRLVGPGRFAALLAPYLVSTAVGGWLGYGDNVDGIRIQRKNGLARDEHALAEFFRARGVGGAMADYWVAYRLTFLFHEDPVVVPWHAALDRYPPYRRLVDTAPVVGYVYDPAWSDENLAYRKTQFRSGGTGFQPDFEEARVGRYTVLVLVRSPKAPIFVDLSPDLLQRSQATGELSYPRRIDDYCAMGCGGPSR
jgi:hypothetical protein